MLYLRLFKKFSLAERNDVQLVGKGDDKEIERTLEWGQNRRRNGGDGGGREEHRGEPDEAPADSGRGESLSGGEERLQAETKKKVEMGVALLRERAQLGLFQSNVSCSGIDLPIGSSYSKLPTMNDAEDPISYFHSVDKVD